MEKTLKERVIAWLWGMLGFIGVAIAAYLINISDVRDIDLWKLATIVITVGAGYVVNQGTKYLRTGK